MRVAARKEKMSIRGEASSSAFLVLKLTISTPIKLMIVPRIYRKVMFSLK
jgi:hypothetical protein